MEPLLLIRGQYLHLGEVHIFFLEKMLPLLVAMFVSDLVDLAKSLGWVKFKMDVCLEASPVSEGDLLMRKRFLVLLWRSFCRALVLGKTSALTSKSLRFFGLL